MNSTLLRTSALRSVVRATAPTVSRAGLAGTTFVRGKATLPDLACTTSGRIHESHDTNMSADDYGALEPAISGKIMELHHKNHHNTYVTSFNNFTEQISEAKAKQDIAAEIALQPMINFHGGGHLNHSLFWENLAPTKQGGGEPPTGALSKAINDSYGSLDAFKEKFNASLAGIQGSGWTWLVQDTQTGSVQIRNYANQDPVVGQFRPILGVDAWEHAY